MAGFFSFPFNDFIEIQFTYPTIYSFKAYNSMILAYSQSCATVTMIDQGRPQRHSIPSLLQLDPKPQLDVISYASLRTVLIPCGNTAFQ